jgi:hypothetical protein
LTPPTPPAEKATARQDQTERSLRSRLANDLKLNIQVSEMFESDSGAGAKKQGF